NEIDSYTIIVNSTNNKDRKHKSNVLMYLLPDIPNIPLVSREIPVRLDRLDRPDRKDRVEAPENVDRMEHPVRT
ncbi:MAG: hypothetical protein LGB07_03410, partial [Sulfurovum sp.]|nr:hypothetical protein [Sulfurovum sp.]